MSAYQIYLRKLAPFCPALFLTILLLFMSSMINACGAKSNSGTDAGPSDTGPKATAPANGASPRETNQKETKGDAKASSSPAKKAAQVPDDNKIPEKAAFLEKIKARLQIIWMILASVGGIAGVTSLLFWIVSNKRINRKLSEKFVALAKPPAADTGNLNELRRDLEKRIDEMKKELEELIRAAATKTDIDIARLSKEQARLEGELNNLPELMRTNDQNVLKQTHEALAGLENRIQAVEQEDLESYFDKWKSHGLEPQLQSAAAQTLKNFTSDPENEKTLHDSVAVLKKVLETAGPWFDAITSCIRALPATQENGAWNEFSIRLQKYCESGAELRQRAQKAIAQSDLSREPAGVVGNLSFFDIASGGSARSISHDYENRLADRLQQVQSTAAEAAQQWQALRDELMKLLDHLDATGSAAGQSHQVSQLETQLRSTLRPLKFQEIPVETNSTVFDPSLHEAIAGGAVARPELPENTIIRLERRGFFYEGKVLRRALVAVSSRG